MPRSALFRASLVESRVVAVVIALVLALAACASQEATPAEVLEGAWEGTWTSVNGPTGTVEVEFERAGNTLSGTITIGGTPCLSQGTITGTVDGNNVAFGSVNAPDSIDFTAQLAAKNLTGTYSVGMGACAGDSGAFALDKVE